MSPRETRTRMPRSRLLDSKASGCHTAPSWPTHLRRCIPDALADSSWTLLTMLTTICTGVTMRVPTTAVSVWLLIIYPSLVVVIESD